jgi:hypothetical protein
MILVGTLFWENVDILRCSWRKEKGEKKERKFWVVDIY